MSASVRSFGPLAGLLLLVVGSTFCSDPSEREAIEANRLYERARDQEESFETLEEAIQLYVDLAQTHPGTEAGQKASVRVEQLREATPFIAGADSLVPDSMVVFYEEFNRRVPDYAPAIRKLGRLYYDRTYLLGRTAAQMRVGSFAQTTMSLWAKQDSLWGAYTFRATSGDRAWQDRLCRQALDVARMLEELGRFKEALVVLNRGIDYATGEDTIAEAKVYAAYYTFTTGDNAGAIRLADEALLNEHLSGPDRARAYHVLGLGYTYTYENSRELPDLDSAIQALNESVTIDPGMTEAKELLKTLRSLRHKLPS